MPQNDHSTSGSLCMFIERSNQRGIPVECEVLSLRKDIWLGIVSGSGCRDADYAVYVESAESVLALAFLVPRLGKGGGDMLPAGKMCMFVAGKNRLPALPGRGLLLCITASRLTAILGPDAGSLPVKAKALLASRGATGCEVTVPLLPEQILAGNALINCPYDGAVRNMIFKSKVLELLALFFGQLDGHGHAGLTDTEKTMIAGARNYLLAHLESPPCVRQIARHIGVNDTKLKRLFKEAYGLSPYAYLRGERMAAAREMLLARRANVSEAASRVGYCNVSHFIEAFTRHYGIRPGELCARRESPAKKRMP